jgi:hypothetical protein
LYVLGGEMVVLTGTNLPVDLTDLKIGNQIVKISSSNDTSIVFTSPQMDPGLYDLIISSNQLGYVK